MDKRVFVLNCSCFLRGDSLPQLHLFMHDPTVVSKSSTETGNLLFIANLH